MAEQELPVDISLQTLLRGEQREEAVAETERLLDQIMRSGVSEAELIRQFLTFKAGPPFITLDRACTIGDGIERLQASDEPRLLSLAQKAIAAGRTTKFVPASGAATRMFKSLLAVYYRNVSTLSELEQLALNGDSDASFTLKFISHLPDFALYPQLLHILAHHSLALSDLLEQGNIGVILHYLLGIEGLQYGALPKALIPFHRYPDNTIRTPLAEHLYEAFDYTADAQQHIHVHYTVSPEHHEAIKAHLEELQAGFPTIQNFTVGISEQKKSTDTISVTPDNKPFLSDDGLHFRPAGHGALLENLNDLHADIVCIKNIDNVVPDRLKTETYRYKRLLIGYLTELEQQIHKYLWVIDSGSITDVVIQEMIDFARWRLYIEFCRPIEEYTASELVAEIRQKFHRPLRVCGMVKNEGEPGGGPFFIREPDGTTSLQIVETAQINVQIDEQKRILEQATHFNPVDLVCAVRDYKGNNFPLLEYRNQDTGFISIKSNNGKELKALELPGLWNGSMAYWNTIFVEVPTITFNPVKTINDLLRDQHQEILFL